MVDRYDFAQWTNQAMQEMLRRNATLAVEQTAGREHEYSHHVVQHTICHKVLEDKQYNANLILLQNTPSLRQFVDTWVDLASNTTLLWHQGLGKQGIRDHRYDQTLLSLLLKCPYGENGKEAMPLTCNRRRLFSFQI